MKKSFLTILTVSTALSFNALADVPSCGENCTYRLVQNNDDNDSPTYTLKVEPIDSSKPASVQDYTTLKIDGSWHTTAPWDGNTSITKLDIEPGITSIGNAAFTYNRSITEITLPEGLEKIGDAAFHRTGITTIDLPNSLKEIGTTAFVTKSLQEVNGNLDNLTTMGGRIFVDTAISDFVVPPNLKNLPDDTFKGKDSWVNYISGNMTNLYCPEALAEQCATALAYRGDEAKVKTYQYEDGVYVFQNENSTQYYATPTDMRNGTNACADLNSCKASVLKSRGLCADINGDCKNFVDTANAGRMLKVGSKTYQSLDALLKGEFDRRRIYTIEEANFVSGKKNSVRLRYK